MQSDRVTSVVPGGHVEWIAETHVGEHECDGCGGVASIHVFPWMNPPDTEDGLGASYCRVDFAEQYPELWTRYVTTTGE